MKSFLKGHFEEGRSFEKKKLYGPFLFENMKVVEMFH
jgi:hypothetical protein